MMEFSYAGQGLLVFAAFLAMSGSFIAFRNETERRLLEVCVDGQAVCLGLSFFSLMAGFIRSDFSLLLVTLNSALTTPLVYKVSGTWSHHEGSLMLWVLIMALFQSIFVRQNIHRLVKRMSVGTHSIIIFLFCLFILVTSNPFVRLYPIPLDGQDLNPMLQDLSVVFHPPLLYLGLQGFSMIFSLSIGVLLSHSLKLKGSEWAKCMRPWALLSTGALTAGICLGSFWAYYELGWGGWWFWDPVENVSLIPWLVAIGLVHSLHVLIRDEGQGFWVLCQALATYALVLVGLVLVRSGALTSVHGFAQDPDRGLILLIMVVSIIACAFSLLVMSFTGSRHQVSLRNYPQLKVWGLTIQSFIFLLAAGVLLLGTIYPPLARIFFGLSVHVGPPFYKASIIPLISPALILLGVLPFIDTSDNKRVLENCVMPLTLLAAGGLLWGYLQVELPSFDLILCSIGSVLGAWLILLTLIDAFLKWQRKMLAPRVIGMLMAHMGVSLFVFSASVERGWSQEWSGIAPVGQSISVPLLGNKPIQLQKVDRHLGPNYVTERAHIDLSTDEGHQILRPEKRYYIPSGQWVGESAQCFGWLNTYYVTIGDGFSSGAITITVAKHPLVIWIWISAMLAALGLLVAGFPSFNALLRGAQAIYLQRSLKK